MYSIITIHNLLPLIPQLNLHHRKEDEIGLDNYKQVDVPQDVAEKFLKEDEEYLKDL